MSPEDSDTRLVLATWDAQTPRRQAYLRALAAGLHDKKQESKNFDVTLANWRAKIANFREIESRIKTDALFAAKFLAIVGMPTAVNYLLGILEDRHPGNKAEAARYIIHIADPQLSQRGPTPPPSPNKGKLQEILQTAVKSAPNGAKSG